MEHITKPFICNRGEENVERNREGRGIARIEGSSEPVSNGDGKERRRQRADTAQNTVGGDFGARRTRGICGSPQSVVECCGEVCGSERSLTAGHLADVGVGAVIELNHSTFQASPIMATFEVAHLREQGVDLIIVPLNREFDQKSMEGQRSVINSLQMCAGAAGLRGTVVPVWPANDGLRFIAPPAWHPFFKSLSWSQIGANINRRLTCG